MQPEDLLILEDDERKKARERGCRISRGQLRPPSESARRALVDLFGLDSDLCGQVDKYAARFLTGGWLEEFLWGVIERHQDSLQVWNVRLGVEVARKGDSSGNDLDIAFIRNHGLAMVECKSGGQEHDPSGEILYKVEAVKRQFGAIRVQSILATTSDKILEQNGSLKTTFENRADIYQCRILSRAEIRRLGKEADSADEVRRILFDPVGQA
ncbi:MAG TPA: DUF1887 family CARF protein [Isosphaeraceae bacterium]|nr:DUF1887 family CARF protein [Isosphaeraceae bacterium]